jgi:hypothetical protein
MEPLDPRSSAVPPPPPAPPRPVAAPVTTAVPTAAPSAAGSLESPVEPVAPVETSGQPKLRMYPWRVLGASAVAVAFGLSGWQVQRVIDEQPRLDAITWWTILAGIVAGIAILIWTWVSTENARRLVSPASTHALPSPSKAVTTWILPFAFIATSSFVVTYLSRRPESDSAFSASSIPLAIAVLSLLLAIPLTYRPVHYLAGVIRQIGGYSAKLAQWMWVPVVLAVVGVSSILLMRFGGAVETTSDEWAPLWIVAVVAIAPCIVVVLLAWRAAESVEEAIGFAFARREGLGASELGQSAMAMAATPGAVPVKVRSTVDIRRRVRQLPGANVLRIVVVTLLAGLALLSVVGAIVMFLFWQESNSAELLPSQVERAKDTIAALHTAERIVAFTLVGAVSLWTFVAVLNVRLASGRRRNPIIAALAWPAVGVGFWMIDDSMIVDQPSETVIAGFFAQAALLYVPFFLLERSAAAVGARRTPVRIAYVLGVVLLVYIQGLGGLSNILSNLDDAQYGRLAGYLFLGALVQLIATLAVTDACRAITDASEREAEHHNLLADQHRQAMESSVKPQSAATAPGPEAAPEPLPSPTSGA